MVTCSVCGLWSPRLRHSNKRCRWTARDYSSNSNLVLNASKTNWMILSIPQISRLYALQDYRASVTCSRRPLERSSSTKLLGVHFDEHLKWKEQRLTQLSSSCYAVLAVLRKLRHIAPFHVRKNVAESLISQTTAVSFTFLCPTTSWSAYSDYRMCAQVLCCSRRYASQEDQSFQKLFPISFFPSIQFHFQQMKQAVVSTASKQIKHGPPPPSTNI